MLPELTVGNTIVNGYVTAPSTPQNQEFGYVFESCKFTSNCPDSSVFPGRPWRNFAKAVFLNCELGIISGMRVLRTGINLLHIKLPFCRIQFNR